LNPYTFHISLYDLVFLGTVFVGLTFALQLRFTKRINRAANRFLGLALGAVVLQLVWPALPFSLAIGPLIYFYVLTLTRPGHQFRRQDLVHFSPLLLKWGALLLEIKESGALWQLPVFISVIAYLFAAHKLIERFYQRMKFNAMSDRYRHQFRWLHRFLIGFGGLWLLGIPFNTLSYFHQRDQFGLYAHHPLCLLSAIMMIWIAAASLVRAETTALVPPVSKLSSPTALRQKGSWLKKVMEENLYYQDADSAYDHWRKYWICSPMNYPGSSIRHLEKASMISSMSTASGK
jgi:putative ABC transport system permease protein